MHHLGCWASDLDAERERLASSGFVPEIEGAALGLGCDYYFSAALGMRIELVSASAREAFAERWGIRA
jgi:hypothetical protein